jgi:predicted metal-dependent phosphoesterase TrpH
MDPEIKRLMLEGNMNKVLKKLERDPLKNSPLQEKIHFDMHLHSRYSADSAISVKTIVKCHERTGILPLVCDHNSITGSQKVYDAICAAYPDLPHILAEEIMTSEGEIIGLFLEEEIPPFLSAEETLDRIRDQGALSIVPHPFCSYRSSALGNPVLDRIIDRLDIIEGFNSRVIDDNDNLVARQYATRHNKQVSAGSDAHTPLELGRTWVILRPFSTPAELMRELPEATVHYQHMNPSIHMVTRFVKAGRHIGLFSPV